MNNGIKSLTVKELYDMLKEGIDDDDFSWDSYVTFENYKGEYFDIHGMSVECNGYEIKLHE